ncbi:MAG: hypothetical protein ACRC1K_09255 [Planctomycetia bacterium]
MRTSFGNTLIEDYFLRTKDDSLYVKGQGVRRTGFWNDANASSFVLSSLWKLTGRKMVVDGCDAINSRAKWRHWTGGRVFNARGEGGGDAGVGVNFRNVNLEDSRPTPQQFFICSSASKPYTKQSRKGAAGDLSGIFLQNVSITARSVFGEPQILWDRSDACIRGLDFGNFAVRGKPVSDAKFFKTNEFVDGLIFAPYAVSNR